MEQIKISMKYLWIKHYTFYDNFVRALAFSNSKLSSFFSAFLLIYFIHTLRRIINRYIILRIYCFSGRICREVIFHICYYYFTRFWFHFMKSMRSLTDYIEEVVAEDEDMKEFPYDLRMILSIFYAVVFTLIFLMTVIYDRSPPVRLHYFSWVNGPRRLLTEMGSSARLLTVEEQIPRVKSQNAPPYKSLRSASAEYIKGESYQITRCSNSEMTMTNKYVME